jgi:hypothetical protein
MADDDVQRYEDACWIRCRLRAIQKLEWLMLVVEESKQNPTAKAEKKYVRPKKNTSVFSSHKAERRRDQAQVSMISSQTPVCISAEKLFFRGTSHECRTDPAAL